MRSFVRQEAHIVRWARTGGRIATPPIVQLQLILRVPAPPYGDAFVLAGWSLNRRSARARATVFAHLPLECDRQNRA